MKAADVMRYQVVTVSADTTVAEAARLMLLHGISGLPVVNPAGTVIGIVTEGDLLRRTETGTERHHSRWLEFVLGPGRLAGEYVHTHGRKVEEVMTRKVVVVARDAPLEEVVGLMERRRVKRLPVVEAGRLVGIVSRADLLKVLAQLAPMAPPVAASDTEIRARVLAEIDKSPWALRGCLDAVANGGVVELRGVIGDERQRAALRVAAENVQGVKKVIDHLVWVEPISGMAIEPPEDASASAAE
jgi:CBS domain-containing protein